LRGVPVTVVDVVYQRRNEQRGEERAGEEAVVDEVG
jgi:hypothetical protein